MKRRLTLKQRKLNFYLVDDSQEFIEAMCLFLENELNGFVCGIANDGDQAIKDRNIYRADIVFMDMNMKRMGGISTARLLTKDYKRIKIVAVSNSRESFSKMDLINHGFYGFISKSKAFEEIPRVIEKVMYGSFYFSLSNGMNQLIR
jgi:DNA-binding NarL/FixJ family response regulator